MPELTRKEAELEQLTPRLNSAPTTPRELILILALKKEGCRNRVMSAFCRNSRAARRALEAIDSVSIANLGIGTSRTATYDQNS